MQQLPPLLLGPPPPGWHGSRHPLQAQHAMPWLGRVAWDLQLPGLATTSSPGWLHSPRTPWAPSPDPPAAQSGSCRLQTQGGQGPAPAQAVGASGSGRAEGCQAGIAPTQAGCSQVRTRPQAALPRLPGLPPQHPSCPRAQATG